MIVRNQQGARTPDWRPGNGSLHSRCRQDAVLHPPLSCREARRLLWEVIGLDGSIPSPRRAPGARGRAKDGEAFASRRLITPTSRVFSLPPSPAATTEATGGAKPTSGGRVEPGPLLDFGARGRAPRGSSGRGRAAPFSQAPPARRLLDSARRWVRLPRLAGAPLGLRRPTMTVPRLRVRRSFQRQECGLRREGWTAARGRAARDRAVRWMRCSFKPRRVR